MNSQTTEKKSLTILLFNPFKYIAGFEALFAGVCILALTAYVASFTNTHFDGVLDTHSGLETPLWFFFAENAANWLSMVVVLMGLGKIVSKTSFRLIDVVGTQVLARWPALITAVATLIPGYTRFSEYLLFKVSNKSADNAFAITDAVIFGIVVVIMIAMTCWMVYLMYKAYSTSCNITGGKAIGTFIAGILLAEMVSKIIITAMVMTVVQDDSWKAGKIAVPEKQIYEQVTTYNFDQSDKLVIRNYDKGLNVAITGGELKVAGKTQAGEWKDNGVHLDITDDNGGSMEFEGSFRIAGSTGGGLAYLELVPEGEGPVILIYQWGFLMNRYWIQQHHLKMPCELEGGKGSIKGRGNEREAFNTLRIALPEGREFAAFYVNEEYIDRLKFSKPLGKINAVELEFQTYRKGCEYDIRFDDLVVRRNKSVKQ